jgi:hypothetical protein
MAINQSLVKGEGSFSYRAPYDRRKPSYNNPTRGAAKASAPASTGSLESRSVVRGPGIENDEMDTSDDADMVTQTQTPLTANARGPRYTEGSMMDLFTGQRTGTKNADYKADQPITDTNTPYLATKGFWGGIDRVLGNKSNELNEAAQQQQGANWNAANKLKDAQNREDTVTNNANTFITGRDAAKVTADKNTATALEKAQEKAAGALADVNTLRDTALAGHTSTRDTAQAGYARDAAGALASTTTNRDTALAGHASAAATAANTRAVAAASTQDGFTKAAASLLASAKTQEQKDKALSDIDILSAKNGYDVEAATAAFKRAEQLQQNALGNEVKENRDGTFTRDGIIYERDPNDSLNMIPINFEKPRGSGSSSGGNIGPGRSPKNGQGGDVKKAAVVRDLRSSPDANTESVYSQVRKALKSSNEGSAANKSNTQSKSSKPAYLSNNSDFQGPLQDPNSDAAMTAAAQMAEYNARPSYEDPNSLGSAAKSYLGLLPELPLVKGVGRIISKLNEQGVPSLSNIAKQGGTGVLKKLASFIEDKAGALNEKRQEDKQDLLDQEMIRRAKNSRKPSFEE